MEYSSPESFDSLVVHSDDELDFLKVTVTFPSIPTASSEYSWMHNDMPLIGGGNSSAMPQTPPLISPRPCPFFDRMDDFGKAVSRAIDADTRDFGDRIPDVIEHYSGPGVRPPAEAVAILRANPNYDSSYLDVFDTPMPLTYPDDSCTDDERRELNLVRLLNEHTSEKGKGIGASDDELASPSPASSKKPKSTKKYKLTTKVSERADAVHFEVVDTLGEDYVNFYHRANPLAPGINAADKETDAETQRSQEFISLFQYAFARKPFGFRGTVIPRALVMTWNGMIFIPCPMLEKIFPGFPCRRLCPLMKKYMRNDFVYSKMTCKSIQGKIGLYDRSSTRLVVSALDAFRIGKWLIASGHDDKTETFEQFMKYLDVEFGAYWGKVQSYPFTHNEFEMRFEDDDVENATPSEFQALYSDYCLHRFGLMQKYVGTYKQSDVDQGNFAAFVKRVLSDDEKLQRHSSRDVDTESEKGERRHKRKKNKEKSKSHKKSKRDEEADDDWDDGFSLDFMPLETPLGKESAKLPFSFKLKWEVPLRRERGNTKFDMVEFDVVATIEPFLLNDRSRLRETLQKWLKEKRLEEGKDIGERNIEFVNKILERMKEVDIQQYAGVPEFVSDDMRASIRNSNNGLDYTDICNVEQVLPLLRQYTDPTETEEEVEMFWITMLSQFVLPDSEVPDAYKQDINSGYATEKNLFRIRCSKRTRENRLIEDAYHEGGALQMEYLRCLGLPIYEDRKRKIMAVMARYALSWPEDVAFFQHTKKAAIFPFWVLTFFVLTMNERERKANNTALAVLHRIYYELRDWYDTVKSNFDVEYGVDAHRAFIRGVKIFRLSYERVEKIGWEPVLTTTLDFVHGASNNPPTAVLLQMLARCTLERDTFIKFFFEHILPQKGKILDMAAIMNGDLGVEENTLKLMMSYGNKLYATSTTSDDNEEEEEDV